MGDAVLGAGAGLFFYGWMFWLRVMGGGDVKLLMALGAWGGLAFTEEVALLGVLLGGGLAVVHAGVQRKMLSFAAKMKRFLLTIFVSELELEMPRVDRKLTMPFGVPIAAAAIWSVLSHPLVAWGFQTMAMRRTHPADGRAESSDDRGQGGRRVYLVVVDRGLDLLHGRTAGPTQYGPRQQAHHAHQQGLRGDLPVRRSQGRGFRQRLSQAPSPDRGLRRVLPALHQSRGGGTDD